MDSPDILCEALWRKLVRGLPEVFVRQQFRAILNINTMNAVEQAVLLAFKTRDIRYGKGERKLFYYMLRELASVNLDLTLTLLDLVPIYGSWDDLFTLASTEANMKNYILEIAAKQIVEDEKSLMAGKPYFLIGKWAPREGKAFGSLAIELAKKLMIGQAPMKHSQMMSLYRKRIARLNRGLNTVEILECSGRWHEIVPKKVPHATMNKKIAAYLNLNLYKEGEVNSPTIRYPGIPIRNVCRTNFIRYFRETTRIVTKQHTPNIIEKRDRYNPIQKRINEWCEGGWRVL